MSYEHFDEGLPDLETESPIQMGISTRRNLVAIRDDVVTDEVVGWATTYEYAPDNPFRLVGEIASCGAARLRTTYTYASEGPNAGRVVAVSTELSLDSGGSWVPRSSVVYAYNASGTLASVTPA